MKNCIDNFLIFAALCCWNLAGSACSVQHQNLTSLKELQQWIGHPANGLVQSSNAGGLELQMCYLPPACLAARDRAAEACTPQQWDSLLSLHSQSMCFRFQIGMDDDSEAAARDVMTSGLSSPEEFHQRVMAMNFAMDRTISLIAGEEQLAPVLTNFENVYGLTPHRSLILVFPRPADPDLASFELQWDDLVYNSGVHRFRFERSHIESVPTLML